MPNPANTYYNEFQVGDVVWHPKKGYIARITKIVEVENGPQDLFIKILTEGNFWTSDTNSSKVRLDHLGCLLYG